MSGVFYQGWRGAGGRGWCQAPKTPGYSIETPLQVSFAHPAPQNPGCRPRFRLQDTPPHPRRFSYLI